METVVVMFCIFLVCGIFVALDFYDRSALYSVWEHLTGHGPRAWRRHVELHWCQFNVISVTLPFGNSECFYRNKFVYGES